MRAELLQLLQGDSALTTLLPGGLYDAAEVPGGAISREHTPAAFDPTTQELRLCALVRLGQRLPNGLPQERTRRLDLSILLYAPDHLPASNLEGAIGRIRTLLRRRRIQPATGGAWELISAGEVGDLADDVLNASMAICRYQVWVSDAPARLPPPTVPFLLLEDGSRLLLEDGNRLLLETA